MSEKNKCILVVDDDRLCRRVAELLFTNKGCEVDLTEDAETAIEKVTMNHERYHGVYMDIGLSNKNGMEACQEIREYEAAHPHLKPLPIFAVAGNFSKKDALQYIEAGMQAVFFKPLNQEKIIDFLSQCK